MVLPEGTVNQQAFPWHKYHRGHRAIRIRVTNVFVSVRTIMSSSFVRWASWDTYFGKLTGKRKSLNHKPPQCCVCPLNVENILALPGRTGTGFSLFFFSTTKTRREWEETQHTQKGGAPSHLRPVLVGQPQCLDQLWIQVPKNWWGLQQSLKKFMQERCTETTSVLGNPCAKKGWKLEKYPVTASLRWDSSTPLSSRVRLICVLMAVAMLVCCAATFHIWALGT